MLQIIAFTGSHEDPQTAWDSATRKANLFIETHTIKSGDIAELDTTHVKNGHIHHVSVILKMDVTKGSKVYLSIEQRTRS